MMNGKTTVEPETVPTLETLPEPSPDKSGWPWGRTGDPDLGTQPEAGGWPKVSIVTATYNQGGFIEETIRSVLLQRYPNLEYIIIDGGSTDNTVSLLKKYDPWIDYWESEEDRGVSHAINKGVQRASGDIVNWVNSDDILLPGALRRVGRSFQTYSQADAIYGHRIVIDAESKMQDVWFAPSRLRLRHLLRGNPLAQECCFWRAELFERVGGLKESLKATMDHDLFARMWQVGQFARIPHFLGAYRMHPGAITSRLTELRKEELDNLPAVLGIEGTAKGKLLRSSVFDWIQQADYRLRQLTALVSGTATVRREDGEWTWTPADFEELLSEK